MKKDPDYFNRYENFAISRSASGVLTVRFHTDGKEHTFSGTTHHDFPRLIEDIAYDRDNKVLVLTGTGETFIDDIDGPSLADMPKLPADNRAAGLASHFDPGSARRRLVVNVGPDPGAARVAEWPRTDNCSA